MVQQAQSKAKIREWAKRAVDFAMRSEWEQAATINREILESAPGDFEALNRLGKALSEMGRYSDARNSFQQVLELSPSNAIARKNLDRIGELRDGSVGQSTRKSVPPHFFIEETGKTGVTALVSLAPKDLIATLTAGETVRLEVAEHRLIVKTVPGQYIGTVDPKIGLRVLRMQRGGNRYEAAIASLADSGVRVIIKECYQHPSQMGRLSFPPRAEDDFTPYVWGGGFEDDEETGTAPAEEWPDESESGLEELLQSTRRRPRAGRRGQRASGGL